MRLYKVKKVSAIGNFDGLHMGHLKLLNETKEISKKYFNAISSVLTFTPHTRVIVNAYNKPFLIYSEKTKLEKLKDLGIDNCDLLKFDNYIRSLSAKDFIKKIIIEKYQISHVVVGSKFKFAFRATGDEFSLKKECDLLGVSVTVVEEKLFSKRQKYSSRGIRKSLKEGKIRCANSMLGRSYFFFCKFKCVLEDKLVYALEDYIMFPKLGCYNATVHFDNGVFKNAKIKIDIVSGARIVFLPIVCHNEEKLLSTIARFHLIEFIE